MSKLQLYVTQRMVLCMVDACNGNILLPRDTRIYLINLIFYALFPFSKFQLARTFCMFDICLPNIATYHRLDLVCIATLFFCSIKGLILQGLIRKLSMVNLTNPQIVVGSRFPSFPSTRLTGMYFSDLLLVQFILNLQTLCACLTICR